MRGTSNRQNGELGDICGSKTLSLHASSRVESPTMPAWDALLEWTFPGAVREGLCGVAGEVSGWGDGEAAKEGDLSELRLGLREVSGELGNSRRKEGGGSTGVEMCCDW